MKLNSTKVRTFEEVLLSFCTNAIEYLTKWFYFSDEYYIKHVDCVSSPSETVYEEVPKSVTVLRFQPMVNMNEVYEEFTVVQTFIANVMQMASFKDMSVGENWANMRYHQEVFIKH
jgi:hypothetical protein